MYQDPAFWHNASLKLASVLEDIGVNERIILKRRWTMLVKETMDTIAAKLTGRNDDSHYYLGSRSEGTLTLEMKSDVDFLVLNNSYNVIQMWEEWQPGRNNLMMIQDENTTPGYCFLQKLYSYVPLPVTVNKAKYEKHAIYKRDKVILKNRIEIPVAYQSVTRNGPALTMTSSDLGYADLDIVLAFTCKSFPRSVSAWLYQQTQMGNISNQMKRYIESKPCYVVFTGQKGSPYEEYEWRISTFIERCLMFNLNITQLQCYVMMKLILKTYFYSPKGKLVSSFVCKNILLLCIRCIPFEAWQPHNLLHVFTFCLLRLKQCIHNGECPHFIIYENNLLRRKLSTKNKAWLVDRIDFVIRSNGCAFLGVKLDDFDIRLKSKFSILSSSVIDSSEDSSMRISASLLYDVASLISELQNDILHAVISGKSDLCNILKTMREIYFQGRFLEKYSCRLLRPLLCSTFGFIKASDDVRRGNSISPEALTWIYIGVHSDVASGRLKYSSMLYCIGNINRGEKTLRQIEERYQLDMVSALCRCYDVPGGNTVTQQFAEFADTHSIDDVQHITAFCVIFLPSEINCTPHELRYEMFRSTPEDIPHRGEIDFWMDWAVIDSLPYLYFLQYKTYNRLQRYDDKCRALLHLANSIFTTRFLGHRETALNLLGQCMEQENRHQDALSCYVMSLRVRERNNVAKIHVCRLLSSLLRS